MYVFIYSLRYLLFTLVLIAVFPPCVLVSGLLYALLHVCFHLSIIFFLPYSFSVFHLVSEFVLPIFRVYSIIL